MIEEGKLAPDFQLPALRRGGFELVDLHDPIERGESVLLVFFPTDFLSYPTTVLSAMADHRWQDAPGLVVWGLSGDSIFAHHGYATQYDIDVTLVSDFHASVASHYNVALEDWEGHGRAPSWAWIFIDDDWRIKRAWSDPPTTGWSTPPVASFIDAIREHGNTRVDPLDLPAPPSD